MAILFGVGSWQVRAKGIYKATRLHAFNLMKFAAIFNSIRFSLRRMRGGQETPLDYGEFEFVSNPLTRQHSESPLFSSTVSGIAGLVGGFLIFGDRNPVNEQISLYICSRLVAALLPRAEVPANFPKGKALPMDRTCFKYFSAACWGAAMFLWTTDGGNGGARLGQGLLNSSNCESSDISLELTEKGFS